LHPEVFKPDADLQAASRPPRGHWPSAPAWTHCAAGDYDV